MLLYGGTLEDDMFHGKKEEILRELPNIFSAADNILVVAYDCKCADHDRTIDRVLEICTKEDLKTCRRENLKFNKEKYQCTILS